MDNPKVAASLREDMLECRRRRDARLAQYLHAAWAEAPDDFSIHSIPGWGARCTLCDEAAVCLEE